MATPSLHPLLHYLRRLSGGTAGGDVDDAQLLRRFLAQRDENAFTTLVQRYGAMVWGLCVRRLGETPEAEDAFQATFLVLVRKARSLRGPELLGPWLYGVAYRTALKLRGQRARLAARETALPEQAAEERPEQVWSDLRPILDEEVNRLPEKYRQPVLLCYLQGLSSEEAARRLGCAKGTIFSRLSRARDLLRQRLVKRGLDVSAGVLAAVLTESAVARAAPPAILCASTIRTSLLFAAGTARQALSAPLAALVEGVLRSMFLSKVKFAVIVLLALGLVGSGVGFVAHRTGAEQPASKPTSAPAVPATVADKAKKELEAKPKPKGKEVFDVVRMDTERLEKWRDVLNASVRFDGAADPLSTLGEWLEALHQRYNLAFTLNEKAFQFENLNDVMKTKIAAPNPIPPMHTDLRTVLQTILDRLPVPSGATYILRKDHIEITTRTFLTVDLGMSRVAERSAVLPLIWDVFEETPIRQALERVADFSGYSVVADPRIADKLKTSITAKLNNVPTDTAVRLLANMVGLSVARLDNVFYVTTAENAKQLREEQWRVNVERFGKEGAPEWVPDKPAK
jgi:RNA polymerase sigma factor (sigma-70 family)